ncbi:MAG: cache domain-containing protein, partial [Leptolinea sp.]
MNRFLSLLQTKSIIAMVTSILVVGAMLSWWMVGRVDSEMRAGLLDQARLVTQTLNIESIKALSGTQADLTSPNYQSIKQMLTSVRTGSPKYRFVYLTGRNVDGAIFVFADSEPSDSPDYSPPGQIYAEVSDVARGVFDSKVATVDGPVSDRWGTWISPLVPLIDPNTGKVLAVLGMDIAAGDWKWDVAGQAAMPIGLLLALFIGAIVTISATRQVKDSRKSILSRLLLPLAGMFILLLVGAGTLLWQQEQRWQADRISFNISRVRLDLRTSLEQQTKALSALLPSITSKPGVQQALLNRDSAHLLTGWQPLFKTLNQENNITHFYFLDADRVCILRVHKPDKFGDRIERFTALEAERTGKIASGIELGPLGTFTLRVIQPVFADGKLVGYVELGKEIEDILLELHTRTDIQLAVVIRKEYLNQQLWEDGMKLLGRQPDWNRLPNSVVSYSSQGSLPEAFLPLADQIESGNIQSDTGQEISVSGADWRVSSLPLQDASGKEVGKLLIMGDITAEKAAFNSRM